MSKREELRSCPKCGSNSFTYWEVADSRDGTELHDVLKCDECGCKYYLVFEYARKETA